MNVPVTLWLDRFTDARGAIQRVYLDSLYSAARIKALPNSQDWPLAHEWRQDNAVITAQGVLRGIHGNLGDNNWTLFTLLYGRIYLVVVNCMPQGFGRWHNLRLSSWVDNRSVAEQLLIPPGWGRAYYVESEVAVVHYKWTTPYEEQKQFTYRYDDSRFGIIWPFKGIPVLSARDSEPL